MFARSIVIESRLRERRRLVSNMIAWQCAGEVVEAQSVDDGLSRLHGADFDGCVVGPNINPDIAARLVRTGISVSKNPECAFIAVTRSPEAESLLTRAGVHGVLSDPYSKQTFAERVQQAKAVAVERRRATELPEAGLHVLRSSQVELLKLAQHDDSSLLRSLERASEGLRDIAGQLELGTLSVQTNGGPSLATRDAIRLALEQAFPFSSQVQQIGSEEHLLLTEIVEWIANDAIRRRAQ